MPLRLPKHPLFEIEIISSNVRFFTHFWKYTPGSIRQGPRCIKLHNGSFIHHKNSIILRKVFNL